MGVPSSFFLVPLDSFADGGVLDWVLSVVHIRTSVPMSHTYSSLFSSCILLSLYPLRFLPALCLGSPSNRAPPPSPRAPADNTTHRTPVLSDPMDACHVPSHPLSHHFPAPICMSIDVRLEGDPLSTLSHLTLSILLLFLFLWMKMQVWEEQLLPHTACKDTHPFSSVLGQPLNYLLKV